MADDLVVGRLGERAEVLTQVRSAIQGRASALLVSGEAGIGKTSLVRETCRLIDQEARVVWATCLPLTSLAVPLLPLRSAVDAPAWDQGYPVLEIDAWLGRAAAEKPVVLVVDDIQWADESTLDVLMYVLAGRADRRLAVLLTRRSGEGEDRLEEWLANVRRLPRFRELTLGRLDRAATFEQLAGLFGRPPDQGLLDAVQERANGNPYLSSLLVLGLPPGATHLPPHLPGQLRAALTRAWMRLSASARELTTLVAVGGRAQTSARLGDVARSVGFTAPEVPLLREAVDAGVLRADVAGRYWFAHPLLAEVLVDGLLVEERQALHASFAAAVDPGDDLDADQIVELADHYEQAGDIEAAYRWALRAAETTAGENEALRLLRRALDLWPRIADPGVTEIDLQHRIRAAAERAGRQSEHLEAVERLLTLIDREQDPLTAALLLVQRSDLRFASGLEYHGLDDIREAHRLTSGHRDAPEHAIVTAELATALLWHTDAEGLVHAAEAARLAGDGIARAHALIAESMAALFRDGSGLEPAMRAWTIAAEHRRFATLTAAAYAACNSADEAERGSLFRRAADDLLALGAPYCHIAEMCAEEASILLRRGDWTACEDRLRAALGSRPGPLGDARTRLVAAELAARQGRQAEAEAHLARAEEVFAVHSDFLVFNFDAVRVILAIAAGDPGRALAIAERGLDQELPSLDGEWLLPAATRVLADHIDDQRAAAVDLAAAVARLDRFRRRHPRAPRDPAVGGREDRALVAADALADAETARGRRDPDELTAWQRSVSACEDAGFAWEEAYSEWRLARAALRNRTTRPDAAGALRRAHALATRLGAGPLLADIESLAGDARISLMAEPAPAPAVALPGLTGREREILGYVLAGRTNTEIAKTLVLSEKTISVHISNMLRKTGSKNRIELAQHARSQGADVT